jgi:large subunit ribosomal protein L9
VTVKVNVARSPEEADLQAQGIDVLEQMFEEEAAPLVAEELAQPVETEEPPAAEAPVEAEQAAEAPGESEGEAEQA